MALNVDRVKVQIDASVTGTKDVGALTKEMAEATGATNSLASATAGLNKQQQSFLKGLGNRSATYGMSPAQAAAAKAGILGVTDQAAGYVSKMEEIEKANSVVDHSFQSMITHGGAFREILVLLHESLIMGNWSRVGGSFMVLAERMEIAPMLFTAMGAWRLQVLPASRR